MTARATRVEDLTLNGVRIHHTERGEGAPILCIHGTSGSAVVWSDAVERLADRGRVIAYDRRGCGRSERPQPYVATSVAEHANDAAALLAALTDAPATVIGRSYGGSVALDLALRHPDRVGAIVLLEPGVLELSAAYDSWFERCRERIRSVATSHGSGAVAEALFAEVLGEGAWESLPAELREVATGNGPAIIAEIEGGEQRVDAATLATVGAPALVVIADDSPPEFRDVAAAIAGALPRARIARVAGGHLIDPAGPEVLDFIAGVAGPQAG